VRFYLSLYLFVAAIYLLSASGRIGLSDGFAMFNVAQSVATEQSLSSEPCDPQLPGHANHCVPGVDGRHYAGFGLVPSILAAPVILCAKWIASLGHVSAAAFSKVAVSIFTAVVSPLVCVILAMWIVKLGYNRRAAMWGAFILAFASPFWNFGVKGFFSEPYLTLALVVAAYLLSSPELPGAAALSGLAFGIGCGCRVNAVVLFPAFILCIFFQMRVHGWPTEKFLRESALFTTGFSVCALLIGWSNYTRFGSPFKTGYHLAYPSASLLFSTPFFSGMSELLFNGEVGLFVFAPWVLMALICFPKLVRAHLPESVLCGTLFLSNLLFFAKYDSWHAGWVAGPRFLTPTLPFLIMAMVPLIERLQRRHAIEPGHRPWAALRTLMLILVIAAGIVQALGVLYPVDRYYNLMTFYGDSRPKPWWAGSIPLASIDFLKHVASSNARTAKTIELATRDQLTVAHEQSQAWAAVSTATTEDEFLRSFPNPENLDSPNLMLFKMKMLGLPAWAVYGYCVSLVLVGLVGLVGLKRYAVVVQP
jgi:hypothetical protein